MTPTQKLISIAGPALSAMPPVVDAALAGLLRARNGFYAFENALHVFASGGGDGMTLERWNEPALWRDAYGDLIPSGCTFFAEDLFGNQFGVTTAGVINFDAESARCQIVAPNVAGWIAALLRDHRVITGWPLAQAWQAEHGPLPVGQRLVARQPFIAGGAYDLANLYAGDAVAAMRFRGDFARQIADLPDGAQIAVKIRD